MTDTVERLRAALADRYRIERELGQGGMATVYLAHDIRHERKVALKVLKPELAAVLGAERFIVEIRTTAALQHPHILPLFDSGSADGFLYYVMPFIDGETLRAKLDRETQLAVDDAVRIASDVASALHYAHTHGVIHRDIKPENILLHDGRPMVADFGIALALSAAAGGRLTESGLSLGTPHYMSPEQATAEKVISTRSDVYSLGSVMYEMLAGQPPHLGGSAQQIIMKIITEPAPPLTTLRKSVPPHVAAAVAKSLEKLPADRFNTAKEFADALANSAFTTPSINRAPNHRASAPSAATLVLSVTSLLLAVALTWALLRPEAPAPVTRYRVALDPARSLASSPWSRLAVSPDGSQLVYMGYADQNTQLFLRTRDHLDGVPIPGTEGAINPAFEPSGTRVAFMDRATGGQIKIVSLNGGAAVPITDSLVGAPGVAWGSEGYIYYDRIGVGALMRVPAAGGKAESIGELDSLRGELQHTWPDVLPNGKGVILTVEHSGPGAGGGAAAEIAVLDIATGKHHVLVRGVFARYARSGHLVYVTADGTLMGVPFDQNKMTITGDAVALDDGLSIRTGSGGVDLALSATGTLWYSSGQVGSSGTFEAVWVRRDGTTTPVSSDLAGLLDDPVLSPDGKRLALSIRELSTQIWIKDLDQGAFSKFTVDSSTNRRPTWSRDGKSVAFVSGPMTGGELRQRRADGSRQAMSLLKDRRSIEEVTFSSDGTWLVYRLGVAPGELDLYARQLGVDSAVPLLTSRADESSPALSPDGRWLAFVSNESSTPEVYVTPFPNTADGRWQISTRGGREPVWAHSGNELFYRTANTPADSQMVMQVTTGRTFVPGQRRALFPLTQILGSTGHQAYTVTPDGLRFVMIRQSEIEQSAQLSVTENLFELLRSRTARR